MTVIYIVLLLSIAVIIWRDVAHVNEVTHAGGVVIKKKGGQTLVLLVSAKSNPAKRVLPKGHLETGEKESTAARREVKEEAGVDAEVIKKLDNVDGFKNFFLPIKTAFYLMAYKTDVAADEQRVKEWCSIDTAIAKVKRPDQRKLLKLVKQQGI